jgi:HlyD family secretion protein
VRKAWLLLIGFLTAGGAVGFFLWHPVGEASDSGYRLAAVERGDVTASVRATGTLNPLTTVLVGSQLSGQVVEILADYNTPVSQGQVVARLFSEQIKSRREAALADLTQARAERDTRVAQIDKARSALQRSQAIGDDIAAQRDRAKAQLEEAQRNYDRQAELLARAVGTQNTVDQTKTQLDIQKAALVSAIAQIASNKAEVAGLRADIALAEAGVKSADAVIQQREAKLRDVEIDLARTDIRSPVDGVVVKRDIELGQTVAASLSAPTLFTIAQDLREIDIYANIDEADVGRLKADQSVSFSVNAYPHRTFEGKVRLVRLGAQTIQNVVTYTAVIGVNNKDVALLPGMTANLRIITEERADVLRIPNAALRYRPTAVAAATRGARRTDEQEGGAGKRPVAVSADGSDAGADGRVYRLGRDGQPEPVQVRLGATDGSFTELLGGVLAEGAAIVIGNAQRDGATATGETPRSGTRPRAPRMF